MRCLFLGYSSNQTKLINFLKKKKISVICKKILEKKGIEKFDLIISFGFKKIIKSDILRKIKRPILNLHMSYLPFNRGAHPNFWSFHNDTKKGVTIHEIDKNLDTGSIIFQKEIKFNIQKDKKITFKKTYNILFLELEKLFIKNYKSIILNNYRRKKNKKLIGNIHYMKNLPKDLESWNISIFKYLNNFITYEKLSRVTYSKLIWRINNDKDSRMYSKNKKNFSYKHHLKWFKQTIKGNKELLYIARKEKKIIGIIRQTKKENKLFLSWALLREFRGKNYGTRLVKEFLKKNKITYFAVVHRLNIKSIIICKKVGFKFLRKKNDFLTFKKI